MIFKTLLCLFFFGSSVTVATKNKWECADYYWRDYVGITPYDAVEAGTDNEGNPRYIGQVFIRGFQLLPATILPKQGISQTEARGHIFTNSRHVKIICSPYSEAFEWISVESKNLHTYENYNLVPAGYEGGENIYFARAFRGGDPIIGKVFRPKASNKGGSFFTDGRTIMHDNVYEMLVYDCNKIRTNFDVGLGETGSKNHIY